ncbi:hypothetical protein SAMN05660662_1356 [Blastococcus aurantiacus]|uniref:Aldehyde dehydrogenase family protein n=1 Tax=Blastococcus aurantiacus TaxID=1550231 RepID=A0A1G7J894_9ACTN|nr:hypothetical protein [Blastococcus aurantiacus]SDF21105.1 hypothetical protein SAMN05660662_1356 [Blastococcus aurantiacus]
MQAEHLADVVGRLARGEQVLPGAVAVSGVPGERIEAAVAAVQDASRRWAALPVGEQWVLEWTTSSPGRARRR